MPIPSVPADRDAVILAVGPGGRAGEFVQLRVSMDAMFELQDMLKAEGIERRVQIQESANVPELAVVVASFAGGLGGLAAVLNAFFKRYQDKAVLMERDGMRYELRGMSPKEMGSLIDRILGKAAEEQRQSEHLYRGLPGMEDG